jgi:DNA-binding response OmpR family regulator
MLEVTEVTHARERTRSVSISPGAWALAQEAYERSVVLMSDCRRMIAEQRAMIQALRSRMTTEAGLAGRGEAPDAPEGATRLLDLEHRTVIGTLTLLPARREIDGRLRVSLTASEWQLLIALLGQRSAVLSRAELAARAWGAGYAGRHGEVEVYVSRLRRKLERAGSPARIQTVRGRGYQLLAGD